MTKHGLGNLFTMLKEMETELTLIEKRIAYAVLIADTEKPYYTELVNEYKKLKKEFNGWMTKFVYENEE
ncbi:hypothetical protein G9G63_09250 [Paenibacillus sp. EKM202P]|uniref:hypothetical protein n=1 Tax=unclassified Paenibacillus TaxID=185978 RepID=UPI0013ECCF8D|nr:MULTISPECIES: hypothetical protein [unclassified Paenibacillus]KAF6565336.1 hypothetical protein G9G63_09250 [Paenibacillus sp. EKM202P]KAF6569338.1 hypothetical protein G9G64_12840 [Paenibacillus sp. EKM207P]